MGNICGSALMKRCPLRAREGGKKKKKKDSQHHIQMALLFGSDNKSAGARQATGRRSQMHAGALPRKANSGRSNVFMHAKSDPFHPRAKSTLAALFS